MSCSDFERLIALWTEGDTTERESRRVRAHLESCAACRALAEDLAASQAEWKTLGAEAVDEETLRQVRHRVLAQVSAPPQPRALWSRRWAWALPAVLLLGAGIWMARQPDRQPTPAPPRPPAVAAVTPAEPPRIAPPRPPVRHVVHRRARPNPKPEPQQPLLVKLETSDPQVIIYWIFDTTGE